MVVILYKKRGRNKYLFKLNHFIICSKCSLTGYFIIFRLDTLMGGDFQQYRANVSCGRPDCVYTATLGKFKYIT